MADIFKMAAVKGGQLQFTILNFTELTDLYVFCVKLYVNELKESKFAHMLHENLKWRSCIKWPPLKTVNITDYCLKFHRIDRFEWFLCQTICLWTQGILICK